MATTESERNLGLSDILCSLDQAQKHMLFASKKRCDDIWLLIEKKSFVLKHHVLQVQHLHNYVDSDLH